MAVVPGVVATLAVYTGGKVVTPPTYESVCYGDGHSEAVRVTYDEDALSDAELMDVFFRAHEPRWPVRRKARSCIWYQDERQRAAAEAALAAREVELRKRVPTVIEPLGDWYEAEEWQQQYLAKLEAERPTNRKDPALA